jgi:hypothetical protein
MNAMKLSRVAAGNVPVLNSWSKTVYIYDVLDVCQKSRNEP